MVAKAGLRAPKPRMVVTSRPRSPTGSMSSGPTRWSWLCGPASRRPCWSGSWPPVTRATCSIRPRTGGARGHRLRRPRAVHLFRVAVLAHVEGGPRRGAQAVAGVGSRGHRRPAGTGAVMRAITRTSGASPVPTAAPSLGSVASPSPGAMPARIRPGITPPTTPRPCHGSRSNTRGNRGPDHDRNPPRQRLPQRARHSRPVAVRPDPHRHPRGPRGVPPVGALPLPALPQRRLRVEPYEPQEG